MPRNNQGIDSVWLVMELAVKRATINAVIPVCNSQHKRE